MGAGEEGGSRGHRLERKLSPFLGAIAIQQLRERVRSNPRSRSITRERQLRSLSAIHPLLSLPKARVARPCSCGGAPGRIFSGVDLSLPRHPGGRPALNVRRSNIQLPSGPKRGRHTALFSARRVCLGRPAQGFSAGGHVTGHADLPARAKATGEKRRERATIKLPECAGNVCAECEP